MEAILKQKRYTMEAQPGAVEVYHRGSSWSSRGIPWRLILEQWSNRGSAWRLSWSSEDLPWRFILEQYRF
jgi:hypothetical protein